MKKLIDIENLSSLFFDEMTIMFGGFMGVGTPKRIVAAILDSGVRGLTLIGNDTAYPDNGVGPLISNNRVSKLIVSHIGTNPITGKKMLAGDISVDLVPQGTLIERIRCGGSGLGGVLTPTGVGTFVEDGKRKIEVFGREYLLETPLRANLAIIQAKTADRVGNLIYERAARNFNPIIAFAADMVVAEVDDLVEIGTIDPDIVMTPGALIDKVLVAKVSY